MAHALFYSLVAVFLAFLARYKSFKYGLEFAFLILALFMGIRYGWGNDYPSYLEMFYRNTSMNDFSKNYFIEVITGENSEFGWKILNMLFKPFGFFTMVFVLTCFEYYVLYKAVKKYVTPRWYWLAVFVFTFNSGFMLTGCSMMRQFFAMTIVVLALKHIIDGYFVKYVCYILLAATFHTSALIMLPFYYIRKFPKLYSTKAMVGVVIGSFLYVKLAAFFVAAILPLLLGIGNLERYEIYIGLKESGGGFGLGVMYFFLIFFIALKSGKYLDRWMYILTVLSSLYVLFIPFTVVAPLVGRVGYYFSYLSVLTFPFMFEKMSRKWWMSAFLLVTILFTIYQWIGFFNSETWHDSMYEYKSILSAPMWM